MRIIRTLLLLILSLWIHVGLAANQHPTVSLQGIERLAQSESGGDELYLAVTVYPSQGKARHYYYPKRPLHWPSSHLDKIKPSEIWDRALNEGENVTVIFALIERDAPPWNTDDLVGEVELQLSNRSTGLESRWAVLSRGAEGDIQPDKADSKQQVATLKGRGGHYQITLRLDH